MTLGYGSEFRPVETMKPLIGSHPNFGKLEEILSRGIPYVFLRDLDEHTKSIALETLLKRRNHKSAKAVPDIVAALLAKDVTHGFAIRYSDAYRKIAHSATAATQTISTHDEIAYLYLRLTFGGSPNPAVWCTVSEIVTNLANKISQSSKWDRTEVHSPVQPDAPEPKLETIEVPMARAKRMPMEVPLSDANGEGAAGQVDSFIDDLINVFLDTPQNRNRQPHTVPLAMHLTSRPHAGVTHEPITRRELL